MKTICLYEKKLAAEIRFPIAKEAPLRGCPAGKLAVALAYDLCGYFALRPDILHVAGSCRLDLLFRGARYDCEDFSYRYGETIAELSAVWPATASGYAQSRETCEISAIMREGVVIVRQATASGTAYQTLDDLCLRITCADLDEASGLMAVFSRLQPPQACIALPRLHEAFCRRHELLLPMEGACFCYLPLEEEEPEDADKLRCLSMTQKTTLWKTFLEDKVSRKEFDWLYGLAEGTVNLLEWELALQVALSELHFAVSNQKGAFFVQDAKGNRQRFDFATNSSAEKIFLRLLFPVPRQPEIDGRSKP